MVASKSITVYLTGKLVLKEVNYRPRCRRGCDLPAVQSLQAQSCEPITRGVTDGGKGVSLLPGKLTVKTGSPLAEILIFSILLLLVGCCFLHF